MEHYSPLQQRVIARVNKFLDENFVNKQPKAEVGGPCLIILAKKPDGVNVLGPGLTTAIFDAICRREMDVEWCSVSRYRTFRLLEKCYEMQRKVRPDWLVLKKNMESLWCQTSTDNPDSIVKRTFSIMNPHLGPLGGLQSFLTIYDDVTVRDLPNVFTHMRRCCGCTIVAVTARDSELALAKMLQGLVETAGTVVGRDARSRILQLEDLTTATSESPVQPPHPAWKSSNLQQIRALYE